MSKCECNTCGKMFDVDIKEQEIEIDGEQIKFVYFTCPKCNEIYKVCIKDARYDELVEDLEKTKSRIRRNNGRRNFGLSDKLNGMVNIKHTRLANHVTMLNSKYTGTFTFVASENNNEEQKLIYLP